MMWYLFHGLLLLACALALTSSVVDSFCSLVPLTSLWFERVRSSSWGPTLVQHIVSTDTKPCKRPAVVFYFLGLWRSPPFRAAAHSSCACPAPVLCCCILAVIPDAALGLTSLAAALLVAFLRGAAGVGASIGQVCVRPWPGYSRAGQLQLAQARQRRARCAQCP